MAEVRSQRHRPAPIRCVWMDAGAVAYHLCDRDLDCDHCPLDRALHAKAGRTRLPRANRGHGIRPAPSGIPQVMGLAFPADRHYTIHHQWVRLERPDRARVGLDALAASLFPGLRQVFLPPTGSYVRRDDNVWHLTYRAGLMPLPSPLTGRVLRTNRVLRRDPDLLRRDPYGRGWLFIVSPHRLGNELPEWLFGEEILPRVRRDLQEGLRLVQTFRAEDSGQPVSVSDGGVWDGDGLRALSRRQHRAVVTRLLRWRLVWPTRKRERR